MNLNAMKALCNGGKRATVLNRDENGEEGDGE